MCVYIYVCVHIYPVPSLSRSSYVVYCRRCRRRLHPRLSIREVVVVICGFLSAFTPLFLLLLSPRTPPTLLFCCSYSASSSSLSSFVCPCVHLSISIHSPTHLSFQLSSMHLSVHPSIFVLYSFLSIHPQLSFFSFMQPITPLCGRCYLIMHLSLFVAVTSCHYHP